MEEVRGEDHDLAFLESQIERSQPERGAQPLIRRIAVGAGRHARIEEAQ